MSCLFCRIPLSVEFSLLGSHEGGLLPGCIAPVSPSAGEHNVGSARCYYQETAGRFGLNRLAGKIRGQSGWITVFALCVFLRCASAWSECQFCRARFLRRCSTSVPWRRRPLCGWSLPEVGRGCLDSCRHGLGRRDLVAVELGCIRPRPAVWDSDVLFLLLHQGFLADKFVLWSGPTKLLG